MVPVVVHFGPIRRMSCLWPSLSGPWRSPMRSCVPDATRVYPGGEKSYWTGHGDGVALLGGDVVVVGVLRVVAEVDPQPADLARRKPSLRRVVVSDGVAASLHTSVVSTPEKIIGWVTSTRPLPAGCPSL